jgi:YfiH family protein
VSLELIRWDAPGPYEVGFSTRVGGVSEGPFASLNLGRRLGDVPERVDENRRRLCAEAGADPTALALNLQRHTAVVNRARLAGHGTPGDGLWTDEPGVPLLALGADCALVALARANGDRPAVAVLHVGWRGVLAGIVEAGVAALGSGTAAVIGPAIGPCCYEVGEEVAAPFRARFGLDVARDGMLDLWSATERALLAAGCLTVERLDLCTSCREDLFFSYRRDGFPRGGHGVLASVA